MSLVKYKELEPILKDVYKLSKERKSKGREDNQERIGLGKPYKDMVYDYLMKLDIDTVKLIQSVMYLGRDYEYPEKTDEEIEKELELASEEIEIIPVKQEPVSNPDGLIDEFMSDLTKGNGWKEQGIEAYQISSKAPLDKYLERAFKILGIF